MPEGPGREKRPGAAPRVSKIATEDARKPAGDEVGLSGRITDVFNCVEKREEPLSIEEMNRIAQDGWAGAK